MPRKTSMIRGLKVGDLVYHLLYGREWVGVLLEIITVHTDQDKSARNTELALVKIQPGTPYEDFFKDMVSKNNRVSDSMGLVSTNWLFRLEEKEKE